MSQSASSTAREALAVLADAPYSSLVTYRRDGTPVAVPVWHAVSAGKVYVFTEAASWKVKRLRRDPRITIATCDWRGRRDGGPEWAGQGRIVDDAATVARAYQALDSKYGWQKWIVDSLSRLAGRYEGRAMLEIELDA